jgi:hypothetical protein
MSACQTVEKLLEWDSCLFSFPVGPGSNRIFFSVCPAGCEIIVPFEQLPKDEYMTMTTMTTMTTMMIREE